MKQIAAKCLLLSIGTICSCNIYLFPPFPQAYSVNDNWSEVTYKKTLSGSGDSEYNNVHCGLKDRNGNLWFGTTGEGIYKYDGKLFTHYKIGKGFGFNSITSMMEDNLGRIWFGTDNGLMRFDGKNLEVVPFRSKNGEDFFLNRIENIPAGRVSVFNMMQSRSGQYWFCTSDGIYLSDGKSFSLFLNNDSIDNNGYLLNNIESILEDANGNIWMGGDGIYLYDGQTIQRFVPNVPILHVGHVRVMDILEDSNGVIWLGTGAGLFSFNGKDLVNVGKDAGIQWVYSILEDSQGNIWCSTEGVSGEMTESGGVWRYDGKTFNHLTTEDGLIHNGVFVTLEDNLGDFWFGTRNMGLCRFDGETFTQFSE